MDENGSVLSSIHFPEGKVVSGRWVVEGELGVGGCGAVYKVQDNRKPGLFAAMKVESNEGSEGVLKLEVQVLKDLQHKKFTIRLLASGKRDKYSFVVITLCGPDLDKLRTESANEQLSESTTLRIGVHSLFAIKQVHDIGYVHRDVKPSNLVLGSTKADCRMVYLIDFGMVRPFASRNLNWKFRAPRAHVQFRGTQRYCSLNAHHRKEQGRVDDLWSFVYMLSELRQPLPWAKQRHELQLVGAKERFNEPDLPSSPSCLKEVKAHLSKLGYGDRPDYKLIYNALMKQIREQNFKFADNYDWEKETMDVVVDRSTPSDRNASTMASDEQKTQECSVMSDVIAKRSVEESVKQTSEMATPSEGASEEQRFPTIMAANFDQRPEDPPSHVFGMRGSQRKQSRKMASEKGESQ